MNKIRDKKDKKLFLIEREIAGILFFLLAAQFLTIIMLAAAIAPNYDFNQSAISDLGTINSTALLFNTSLIIAGLFNILGGYFYYKDHNKVWLLVIFILAGIGAIGAGIFPLDKFEVHGLFALFGFLFFNLEVMACGIIVKDVLRVIAILMGIVGFIFVIIMIIGDAGNPQVFGAIGHGGAERMIVYPAMLFLMALGGNLTGTEKGNTSKNI